MRILHISKYYSPIVGGIEDVCYNVVSLLKENCEQYVLSLNNSSKTEVSYIDEIQVTRCGCHGIIASQPISISLFFRMRHLLKSFDPDIVTLHLPNPLACLYLILLIKKRTKLVLHWHSDIVAQKYIYRIIKPIERAILKRADTIIVTSPNYLEHSPALAEFKSKCKVIPNVISPQKMALKDNGKVLEIIARYNHKPIIFFLGRHVEYKGIQYLVEAADYIKNDCSILIAGKGPLTEKLIGMTKDSRITFLGRIEDEDIAAYMHAADIFAFPSITKNEAFGVALAEAMYCKAVPVTFTIPCSGVNWVSVNNETGLEVANQDSRAYGKAIECLLNDSELKEKLAVKARERVIKLFTPNAIRKDLLSIYTLSTSRHS